MKIGVTERGDAALDLNWKLKIPYVDGFILITKDPAKLLDKYSTFPSNSMVHCVITGYGGTPLEPNVPNPEISLKAYDRLIDALGPDRVVLRIDPIIIEPEYRQPLDVIKRSRGRVRVSFIDLYPHVRDRFRTAGIHFAHLDDMSFHYSLDKRKATYDQLNIINPSPYRVEVCGEPGLPCFGCVSSSDLNAMGLSADNLSGTKNLQRFDCTCIAEKVELLDNKKRCFHNCQYCYWKD